MPGDWRLASPVAAVTVRNAGAVPEGVDGQGVETVAGGQDLLSGVEHISGHQSGAEPLGFPGWRRPRFWLWCGSGAGGPARRTT